MICAGEGEGTLEKMRGAVGQKADFICSIAKIELKGVSAGLTYRLNQHLK